ncbi:MAG: hypothetical protein H7X97_07435 [Opitutaceae bacterium]|nr:hypothetical protein [Verrucomicrobiales bacterium]
MKPNIARIAGVLIFLAMIGLGVGWRFIKRPATSTFERAAGPPVTLPGKIGGEKVGFIEDPEVRSLLAKSSITLDAKKEGSVEMMRDAAAGQSFLWPASQLNLESFRESGGAPLQAEEIFQSPLVFYSWDTVTDVLVTNGIVEKVGETYYVTDTAKLVGWVDQKKKWKDVGLSQLYSGISIQSTDPAKSNSGNMWAALLANIYNGGEVLTPDKADAIIPKVKAFFERVGFMESSSGTLFDKYLKQGAGAYPIIVAYENQLLEFAAGHRELIEPVKKKLRILYPRPTVWASHPLIALDPDARRLIAAFKDPEMQRIAWDRHGFRSGLMGAVNTATTPVSGVPPTIDGVMPLPALPIVTKLTEALNSMPR